MNITRNGDTLHITVNLKAAPKVSSTGKSLLIETTSGYTGVSGEGDFKVSVNVTGPLTAAFADAAKAKAVEFAAIAAAKAGKKAA